MTLAVIGTGFGRTGTLSLKTALEQLGFGPCHHMEEVFKHPAHAAEWHRFSVDGLLPSDMLDGYRSVVDWPGSAVWRELHERHPDARFIHSVRDPERWWQSTADTIFRTQHALAPWVRRAVPHAGRMVSMTDRLIWTGIFEGRFLDKDFAISKFEAHTAEVVASIPPEQLLVFEPTDGWEPLCAFLDVPIPPGAYPNVNDRASMLRKINAMRAVSVGAPALGAAAGAAAVIGSLRRYKT